MHIAGWQRGRAEIPLDTLPLPPATIPTLKPGTPVDAGGPARQGGPAVSRKAKGASARQEVAATDALAGLPGADIQP